MVLGKILLTFITVLVGVNLIPSVADTVFIATTNTRNNSLNQTNISGTASAALLNLVPLFFVLGILLATIMSTVEVLNKFNF